MKKLKFYFVSSFLLASANYGEKFDTCHVAEDTTLRLLDTNKIVKKGSLAVDWEGEKIGYQEILDDQMIYFKDGDLEIDKSIYAWLYNPVVKIGAPYVTKYYAKSYGEDVIISIIPQDTPENGQERFKVEYSSSDFGLYLQLDCHNSQAKSV